MRGQQLDDSRLRVSMRGYQAFGARFAPAQRKVILGDRRRSLTAAPGARPGSRSATGGLRAPGVVVSGMAGVGHGEQAQRRAR
ncbi:hypothetical protein [Streptomyces sp. NPDC052107]|uniref:hypothetical protein n=1 Tax=Streptomyces sp. NPDC052107 TaxID=3155632 RepID=UPI003429E253